jgi:hypothetical protein
MVPGGFCGRRKNDAAKIAHLRRDGRRASYNEAVFKGLF